ncbi:MAG: HEAT repeat domain-containing protein [Verrucomicrobiota bacterium]
MKKRLFMGLAVLCLVAVVATWAWRATHREAEHEGKPVSHWVEQLANPKVHVLDRVKAEDAMYALGSNAVPVLVKLLRREESIYARSRAAVAPALSEGILRRLPEPLPAVNYRRTAARLLGNLGPASGPAVPELVRAVGDPDRQVRGYSYEALRRAASTPVVVAALAQALRIPDETIRVFAAGELSLYDNDAAPALPVLIATLEDPDATVRLNVIHTLGRIGREATNAIPALVQLLDEPKVEVRLSAATTIVRLDARQGKVAVPALLDVVRQRDATLMEVAIEALGDLGADAQGASGLLEPLLDHEDARIRRAASAALRRIGFPRPVASGGASDSE